MVQRRGGTRLADELIHRFGILPETRSEQLQDDVALKPFVAGAINLAHPALAQGCDNLIRADAYGSHIAKSGYYLAIIVNDVKKDDCTVFAKPTSMVGV
jgi:hypothetical protein